MDLFLTYTILGLVLGSVYAIAASGLVLTYTTSGIFNFAHGAQAMLAAFLYWQFKVAWGMPTLVAFVLVVCVIGPLLGIVLYNVLMKGLRDVEEVTKVVVTVAVLLGMVALSQWIWDPTQARKMDMLFGSSTSIDVFGVVVRYHELLCVVSAIALAVALRLVFTRTRLGVTMRAVVDDPDLLRLNGYNPERIAMSSWALGSGLAAFAGVLVTPVAGGSLEANTLTLLVIDTFAAAMFGRLRSIPRTFACAIALGLVVTYAGGYAPTQWDWVSNFKAALPMVVLFLVLLVLPQDRLRGTSQTRTRERARVPSVRQAAVWGLAFVAIMYLILQVASPIMVGPLIAALVFAVIALSLVPLTGYAGEINLAPLSFGAIGVIVAFHTGIVGTGLAARLNWVGIVAGTIVTALVGGLVALPALRLRGLYLALGTMAFGGIVSTLVIKEIQPRHWFGLDIALFPAGILVVPPPKIGPLDMAKESTFLMTLAVLFAVLGIGIVALRNTGYGRRLAAMKDSPAATAMLGQSLVKLKLSVFMLSAGIAGLGGILMASTAGSVSAENFLIVVSLSLVMLTVVGGVSHVSGALFGGVMVGLVFTLISGTFSGLAIEHPEFESLFGSFAHLFAIAVALMGIGVNQNPTGVVHQICESYRPLRNARPVLYAGGAVAAGVYVLNYVGVYGDWWLAILMFCGVLLLPIVGRIWMPERMMTPAELAEHEARRTPPPELMGLDQPLSDTERFELDLLLGLPPRPLPLQEFAEELEQLTGKDEVHAPA
ncbi:MAG: transporter permease [Nocardioides sp.]|nr:transporter permease [Nocardioides sp.]